MDQIQIFRVVNGFVVRVLDDSSHMCEPGRSKTYVFTEDAEMMSALPEIMKRHLPPVLPVVPSGTVSA